jgi:hypothetical protein
MVTYNSVWVYVDSAAVVNIVVCWVELLVDIVVSGTDGWVLCWVDTVVSGGDSVINTAKGLTKKHFTKDKTTANGG